MKADNRIVGVVGACGSGKTELVKRLKKNGYQARHIAQEHSFAPQMWQRLAHPDLLIFLHVSYPVTLRRKSFHWNRKEYEEQLRRLEHARRHADCEINTDDLTPDEVYQRALECLNT